MNRDKIRFSRLGGDFDAQKFIFQANIPFMMLKESALFTYMEEDEQNANYQRRTDEKRLPVIKNFIKDSLLKEKNGNGIAVLFPTAMLLATQAGNDLAQDKGSYIWNEIFQDETPQFMIVDGQHRLKAMIELYNDYQEILSGFASDDDEYVKKRLEDYRFNCTVMINFDMWEQAQIFADVNFTQKKVSKDLYYSIYGMNPPVEPVDFKKNCIYIAHNLVKLLNNNALSPFMGNIRMLGNGKGVISQAAMADAFIEQMRSPKGIWYVDPYNAAVNHRNMAVEAVSFFSAIKELFPKMWIHDGKHVSIICKTSGFAALVKLMRYVHRFKLDKKATANLSMSPSFLNQEYKDSVIAVLNPLKRHQDELFGFDGNYAGTGGKGIVNRLYERMISLLD